MPIIPLMTQALGCQMAIDSDFCPGATDGNPITAMTDRSGANGVLTAVGAVALPTYRAQGWMNLLGQGQSCLEMVATAFSIIGTDVAGCLTGVGKFWHQMVVYCPLFLNQPEDIPGGWTNSAGNNFANGMTTWTVNQTSPGFEPTAFLQGKGGANVATTTPYDWAPMIQELTRESTSTVGLTYSGGPMEVIAYGSGTNFDANGWTSGAWPATGGVTNVGSTKRWRMSFAWNRRLARVEQLTMYTHIRTYVSGLRLCGGLGAP